MARAKRQFFALEQKSATVWLVLGPSGVGKSSFGNWLAAKQNWLHVEVDRYPDGDGIDLNNLRGEWNEFYERGDARRLGQVVAKRLESNFRSRGVLTFPGTLVLPPDRIIAASHARIRTIYLYGSADQCITAFLKREQQNGRGLDVDHWIANNIGSNTYTRMGEPAFAPYRIHVFTRVGTRRPHVEVFETLMRDEASN